MSSERDFDLVVHGATGFTGQLVAEYLVQRRPGIRWALGGRSREKLERVRAGLAAFDPAAGDLPIVTGDSADASAMEALAQRTRVVCTTVGPYALHGAPLVAACAAAGTAYCDLTGEPNFMRAMIDQHHDRAVTTGARIVHACGFDSIPSDLGVLMLHTHLAARGDALTEARYRVVKMTGGISGGTAASMFAAMESSGDPELRRAFADPYALNPKGSPRGPDGRDALGPGRDADGRFTSPFIMGAVNSRVVRRSNALLDYAYGRDFRYDEAVDTGRGLRGLGRSLLWTAGLGAAIAAVLTPPGRMLLARVLPSPGEGPSREVRERGRLRVDIRARSRGGDHLTGVIAGELDPGYGLTAVMIGQAALCLAEDPPSGGGVLTPATAMGMKLVERLRGAGMTFRVE